MANPNPAVLHFYIIYYHSFAWFESERFESRQYGQDMFWQPLHTSSTVAQLLIINFPMIHGDDRTTCHAKKYVTNYGMLQTYSTISQKALLCWHVCAAKLTTCADEITTHPHCVTSTCNMSSWITTTTCAACCYW